MKDEKRNTNSLGGSVKKCTEYFTVSKIANAHLTKIEGYHSIRYFEGFELSHLQCCKTPRALAA